MFIHFPATAPEISNELYDKYQLRETKTYYIFGAFNLRKQISSAISFSILFTSRFRKLRVQQLKERGIHGT